MRIWHGVTLVSNEEMANFGIRNSNKTFSIDEHLRISWKDVIKKGNGQYFWWHRPVGSDTGLPLVVYSYGVIPFMDAFTCYWIPFRVNNLFKETWYGGHVIWWLKNIRPWPSWSKFCPIHRSQLSINIGHSLRNQPKLWFTNAISLVIYYTICNLIGFLNLAIMYQQAEGTLLSRSPHRENRHWRVTVFVYYFINDNLEMVPNLVWLLWNISYMRAALNNSHEYDHITIFLNFFR